MPYSEDQVYQPENFKFATKAEGREPTLYFRTNHGSGRLRQQHKHGPKIQPIRKHTSHAFFPNIKSKQRFAKRFAKGMTRTNFRQLRSDFGGRHTPTEGHHHYEATFDAHSGQGKATTTHSSGGVVVGPQEAQRLRNATTHVYQQMSANRHGK